MTLFLPVHTFSQMQEYTQILEGELDYQDPK